MACSEKEGVNVEEGGMMPGGKEACPHKETERGEVEKWREWDRQAQQAGNEGGRQGQRGGEGRCEGERTKREAQQGRGERGGRKEGGG